jgi:L-ribulose-5-phosphate 3-epimerase
MMRLAGHTLGTPHLSLESALRLFRQAGLEGAEIIWQDGYPAGIPEMAQDSDLRQVRRWARELSLEIACLTPYMTGLNSLEDAERERDVERFVRCLRAAEQLDCRRIRVYAGSFLPGEEALREAKWKRLVEALKHLGGIAEGAGVVLCVENHFNTMTVTAAETVALMQAVQSAGVGILYDQANLTFTHSEPHQTAIPLQRAWIHHVHVKDLIFTDPHRPFTASAVATVEEEARAVRSRVIGEGILDWPAIVRQLQAHGYEGYLSFEYEYRWHPQDLPAPEEGFRRSAQVMREILARLAAG